MEIGFTELYQTYKGEIYGYFYRMTLNKHCAEELTQDTFLRAFRFLTGFRGESSARTWLYKIARNTYLSYVKSCGPPLEDIEEHWIRDQQDHEEDCTRRMIIDRVLKTLSAQERELITLRDIAGFSYSEISRITKRTEGQVRMGLHRARCRFRELYLRYTKGGEA